jgi:hypothetical protein
VKYKSWRIILESKYRRNALVPISRPPPEILRFIFSFVTLFKHCEWDDNHVSSLLPASHVYRLWRDTAVNYPHLWSHIKFAKVSRVGITELLARAKMTPLHLEARCDDMNSTQLDFFERQLEAHISHTRHLCLSGEFQTELKPFKASAPALEFLSLSYCPSINSIPDALFNITAPKLACLEASRCGMNWKSPLLKGLQSLEICFPRNARPLPEDWLDALDETPQLEALILDCASPICFIGHAIISSALLHSLPSLSSRSLQMY